MLWVQLHPNFLAYKHFDKLIRMDKSNPARSTKNELIGRPSELENDFCDFLYNQNKFFPAIEDKDMFVEYDKLICKYLDVIFNNNFILTGTPSISGVHVSVDCTILNCAVKDKNFHAAYINVFKFISLVSEWMEMPKDIQLFITTFFSEYVSMFNTK